MDTLVVIYTFNRPKILQMCLDTCFVNAGAQIDEAVIIDDCSEQSLRDKLYIWSKNSLINFINLNQNNGIGHVFELGYLYTKWRNPKTVIFIESDYILRVNWLKEALAVLEAKPNTLCVPLYSNPDYYDKSKTEEMFGRITVDDFGSDLAKREFLHKPFKIQTELGEIEVQGTDHSCGSFVMRWDRVSKLMEKYPEMQIKVFDRAYNKQPGGNRRYAGDGPLTGGMSWYWYKELEDRQNEAISKGESFDFDYSTNAPWLDICDYSIGNHINGQGLNGSIVPEGHGFVHSPKFNNEYLQKNPRENK